MASRILANFAQVMVKCLLGVMPQPELILEVCKFDPSEHTSLNFCQNANMANGHILFLCKILQFRTRSLRCPQMQHVAS